MSDNQDDTTTTEQKKPLTAPQMFMRLFEKFGDMFFLNIYFTISCIPGNVRLIRSVVMTVADQDYVEAARSYGTSNKRIIFRYVLPNAMGPIIVNTTMMISDMILSAAGLSFIGMGIQPPTPEWGALLSNAQTYIFSAPYMLFFPGIFINTLKETTISLCIE